MQGAEVKADSRFHQDHAGSTLFSDHAGLGSLCRYHAHASGLFRLRNLSMVLMVQIILLKFLALGPFQHEVGAHHGRSWKFPNAVKTCMTAT